MNILKHIHKPFRSISPLLFSFIILIFLSMLLSSCAQQAATSVDADQDNINDAADLCPRTQVNDPIGKSGCSPSQLQERALLLLAKIPVASLSSGDVVLLQSAQEQVNTLLDPSLYDHAQLTCASRAGFLSAQQSAVASLENLSCIFDGNPALGVVINDTHYRVAYERRKLGKVKISADDSEEVMRQKMYENITVSCSKAGQEYAGKALEELLSAQLILADDASLKSACGDAAKQSADRNIALSVENHEKNKFLAITENLDVAWRYAQGCVCGEVYPEAAAKSGREILGI